MEKISSWSEKPGKTWGIFLLLCGYPESFSALTLLVGWQEGHSACKNSVVGCCHGYLSAVRCRLAYGPADATGCFGKRAIKRVFVVATLTDPL